MSNAQAKTSGWPRAVMVSIVIFTVLGPTIHESAVSDETSEWCARHGVGRRSIAVRRRVRSSGARTAPGSPATVPPSQATSRDSAPTNPGTIRLFDGESLGKWKETDFGTAGAVAVEDGNLVIRFGEPMSGVTWDGEPPCKDNYEITLDAMRVDGSDFFCGLTFPVGDDPCSLIVGGWGGNLVGLSSINGFDASENETTSSQAFESKMWYRIRVRVVPARIEAWIDDKQVANVERADRRFSVRIEVEASRPLGVATYRTTAALRNIQMRPLPTDDAPASPQPSK